MRALRKLADNTVETSAAHGFRLKRFQLFLDFIAPLPRPVRILDIGGTEGFWQRMGATSENDVHVTLVNVVPTFTTLPNFRSIVADGCDLSMFRDNEFPVVFSNSVIEHVPRWEDQHRMANEIRRVGESYFVQTPNRYFPIEPHFLFPFFQFLPLQIKIFLLRHYPLGWAAQAGSRDEAVRQAASIRLLTRREMTQLFPKAEVYRERFYGVTKSFVVLGKASPGTV